MADRFRTLLPQSIEVLRPLHSLEILRLDHNFLQVMAIWELPKVHLTLNDNPWNCSDCRFAVKAFNHVAGQPDRVTGLNSRY